MLRNKRKGKFYVSRRIGEMAIDNEWLRECLFSNFVIIRAEYLFYNDQIEYIAYSPLFREVEEGESIPRYELIITEQKDDEGNIIKYDVEVKEREDIYVYDNQLW